MISTLPELRKALELHYGHRSVVEGKTVVKPREYDEVARRDLGVYLTAYKGDLQALFDQVTLDVSVNYGRLPDKAQINRAAEKLAARAGTAAQVVKPVDPNDEEVVRIRRDTADSVSAMLADLKAGRLKAKPVERDFERMEPWDDDSHSDDTGPAVASPAPSGETPPPSPASQQNES